MSELCRSVPELGSAVLLDECAKFKNLDFFSYGLFTPRDVEKIALSLDMFNVVHPYSDQEILAAQLLQKQSHRPELSKLATLAMSIYEQIKVLQNNEELIQKFELVLAIYRTFTVVTWAIQQIGTNTVDGKAKLIFLWQLLGKLLLIIKLLTSKGHAVAFA
jgi:hypothetical protein